MTDGPFARRRSNWRVSTCSKPLDLDAALAMAAKIPPAREGCVEVRRCDA